MYLETDRIYKRRDLFESLEDVRKASKKSGIVNMKEIEVSINPTGDLWMYIKPYRNIEDFNLLDDWKNVIDGIYLELPINNESHKKLDKLYGEDFCVLKKPRPLFGIFFKPLSKNPSGWDYYNLTFNAGRSLCDKEGKQFSKALETPNTYNSKMCHDCPEEFKNYCIDIISILNKYSTSIPGNIRIKK
jgi:hypothetical protein